MDSDEEDVKKMTELVKKEKSSYKPSEYEFEFKRFVSLDEGDSDYDFDDDELQIIDDPQNTEDSYDRNFGVSSDALTEDERYIIDSCTDPTLKELLILNRRRNIQLNQIQRKLKRMLFECEEMMQNERTAVKEMQQKESTQFISVPLWRLAAPYFKDNKFFKPPCNEDVKRKHQNNELTAYDFAPSQLWSIIELNRLTNTVKLNYNINLQTSVMRRLNALKAKGSTEPEKQEEIAELEIRLSMLKKNDDVPPRNSDEFIDWDKVSKYFAGDKHRPLECRAVWHMILHPEINKSPWLATENKKLQELAQKYNNQNWELITTELGTNRTSFSVCLHFHSELSDKFKKNKFTLDEDEMLIDVVDYYKVGDFIPWNKVSRHFTNRYRHQLYHRYTYFLSKSHVKKGRFTEAEDILLLILINRFGRNFKACAEYMPHRSQVQLKSRYTSNLQRNIKKGNFSVADDEILYNYIQEHGDKSWTKLSEKLSRCGAQLRQRYRVIQRFLQSNPNARISDMPRRKHIELETDEVLYNFLHYVADLYKKGPIPTISTIEECIQLEKESRVSPGRPTRNPEVKNIDDMLTDFFGNSLKIRESKTISEPHINEAVKNVRELLSVFNASLEIPKNFEFDPNLDSLDVAILESLSNNSIQTRIDRYVAPNINTVVGLRSLLIKHKEYKAKRKNVVTPKSDDDEIVFHRNLFMERFKSLFKWSAILSLEKPSLNMENPPVQKRPSEVPETSVKKRKIDLSTISYNQSILVDGSVVDKLVQSKSVNVIKLNAGKGPNGNVVPLIAPSNTRTYSKVKTYKAKPRVVISPVEQSTPSCNEEEYKSLQQEVQLLDKILEKS